MVPVPRLTAATTARYSRAFHLLFALVSAGVQFAARFFRNIISNAHNAYDLNEHGSISFPASSGNAEGGRYSSDLRTHHQRRSMEIDHDDPKFIVFVVLIPVLVLLSGLFAGLTLGYMSLDETQLNVLSVSGTP